MLSNHPLRQILLMEAGIDKTVSLFRGNEPKREHAASFNRNRRDTFSFIMDAGVDYPDLLQERHVEVVYSYLYVAYVNELCRFADSKNGRLFGSFAHYHDVCDAFNVLTRQHRQKIAQELSDITEAVVALNAELAQSLAWKHIKNMGKKLRDGSADPPRLLPVPAVRASDTVSMPVVEALVEKRMRNIRQNCSRLVSELHKQPQQLKELLKRLRLLLRVQGVALEGMEYEKGELFDALRRTWLAADTAFHDAMYEIQAALISCSPNQVGWNPKIVWYLGSQARPGHVRESVAELQRIYSALKALDADRLRILSSGHVHENIRRHAVSSRSGGGFSV